MKLSPPRISSPVFFSTLSARFHHSPAFWIHSIIHIGHSLLQPSVDSSLMIKNRSFRYAVPHLWNKLPPTLRVPYQFDPSSSPSSSPSLYSDLGPLVDLSRGVFTLVLKLSFSRSLSLRSRLSLHRADLEL